MLPPEVWSKIIGYIPHSKDLQSLSELSCEWALLVQNKWKRIFLFPIAFPHILQYISHRDILNLRLGCTFWKNSIAAVLQQHPSNNTRFDEVPWNDYFSHQFNEFYKFHNDAKLQVFKSLAESYIASGTSPFITNRIYVKDGASTHDKMWNALVDLVQVHGRHISYCTFVTSRRLSALLDDNRYKNLCRCLEFMENLEILNVHFGLIQNLNRSQLKECKLPKLKSLVGLKVDYMPYTLLNELIQSYGGQVKKLIVRKPAECQLEKVETQGRMGTKVKPVDVKFEVLKNVEELTVHYISPTELNLLKGTNLCKLRALSISLDLSGMKRKNYKMLFQKCIDILSRSAFGSNLRHLVLQFASRKLFGVTYDGQVELRKYPQLNLPRLESLTLVDIHFSTIDFILPLVSLTQLRIVLDERWKLLEHENDQDCMLHWDCEIIANMFESGIWRMLSRLEVVTINVPQMNVLCDDIRMEFFYRRKDKLMKVRKNLNANKDF